MGRVRLVTGHDGLLRPDLEVVDAPDAWHPEDALFVPLRHSDGHHLGIMSVDEPGSGARPSGDDLAVLSALAAHAAGGDEFALILEDAGAAEATSVVERIGAGIAAVDAGAGHALRASFGVALGDGGPDPEALLRVADAAMYEAKRAGEGVRIASVAVS